MGILMLFLALNLGIIPELFVDHSLDCWLNIYNIRDRMGTGKVQGKCIDYLLSL